MVVMVVMRMISKLESYTADTGNAKVGPCYVCVDCRVQNCRPKLRYDWVKSNRQGS